MLLEKMLEKEWETASLGQKWTVKSLPLHTQWATEESETSSTCPLPWPSPFWRVGWIPRGITSNPLGLASYFHHGCWAVNPHRLWQAFLSPHLLLRGFFWLHSRAHPKNFPGPTNAQLWRGGSSYPVDPLGKEPRVNVFPLLTQMPWRHIPCFLRWPYASKGLKSKDQLDNTSASLHWFSFFISFSLFLSFSLAPWNDPPK